MKKLSIALLAGLSITTAVFFNEPTLSFAQKAMKTTQKSKKQEQHPYIIMMDDMMMKMHTAEREYIQCTDINFLASMIPHHQGAIDMSQYQLKYGKDSEMLALAKSIIAEQEKEIKEMNALVKAFKTCPKDEAVTREYQKAMAQTMKPMMANFPTKAINAEKNPDRAFALAMIPHHQAAVDMSLVILQYTSNEKVRRLAEGIISSQQREIKQMKDFLAKTK